MKTLQTAVSSGNFCSCQLVDLLVFIILTPSYLQMLYSAIERRKGEKCIKASLEAAGCYLGRDING